MYSHSFKICKSVRCSLKQGANSEIENHMLVDNRVDFFRAFSNTVIQNLSINQQNSYKCYSSFNNERMARIVVCVF